MGGVGGVKARMGRGEGEVELQRDAPKIWLLWPRRRPAAGDMPLIDEFRVLSFFHENKGKGKKWSRKNEGNFQKIRVCTFLLISLFFEILQKWI